MGLGLLLPVALVAGGLYAITAESVRVPAHHPHLPANQTISGTVADGFGFGLIGAAVILFSLVVLKRARSTRSVADPLALLGLLVVAGGIVYAMAG